MNNLCSKDGNRLLTQNIKQKICVKVNSYLNYSQFQNFGKDNREIKKTPKLNIPPNSTNNGILP